MDVKKFFRSFRYAYEGIQTACKEQNFRFHLLSAVIVMIAGFASGLTHTEWAIILSVIGLMFAFEMMNTAIEKIVDLASPTIHPLAKQAKDIAAAAVLVFATTSVIIGLLIFLPKWF